MLISVLVDSYRFIPIGEGLFQTNAIAGLITWSSQMFVGAVSLVLPVLLGLLMINVCLGVISKASPSLNIFAVGFPALIPIGLVLASTNPIGISAGKPTAKIFRLGDALEITPKQTLIISKPSKTGSTKETAPTNIWEDHVINPAIALV